MEQKTFFYVEPEKIENDTNSPNGNLEIITGREATKEELECIKNRSSFLTGTNATVFVLIFGMMIGILLLISGYDLLIISIGYITSLLCSIVLDFISFIVRKTLYTKEEKIMRKAFKRNNYEVLDENIEIISEKQEQRKYNKVNYVAFVINGNTYYWYEYLGNHNYNNKHFVVRFMAEELEEKYIYYVYEM